MKEQSAKHQKFVWIMNIGRRGYKKLALERFVAVTPCPALPCPALPCPALPCPALPCPALSLDFTNSNIIFHLRVFHLSGSSGFCQISLENVTLV